MAFTSRRRSLHIRAIDLARRLEQPRALLLGQLGQQRAVGRRLFQDFGGGLQLREGILAVAVVPMSRHFVDVQISSHETGGRMKRNTCPTAVG